MAIAATLLVLEIGRESIGADEDLGAWLLSRWPQYLAYLVSFTVIGLIWVAHHGMFDRVRAVDRLLLFSNLALLLLVGFIPFPTQVLATYIEQGGRDAAVATAFYSGVMTVIGIVFSLQWWYLDRHPNLMVASVGPAQLRRSLLLSFVSPVAYALTIPLAFVNPYLSVSVYVLLALYFARGPSARALTALWDDPDRRA